MRLRRKKYEFPCNCELCGYLYRKRKYIKVSYHYSMGEGHCSMAGSHCSMGGTHCSIGCSQP